MATLKELSDDVYAAARALEAAVQERITPGDEVHVRHGDHETPAEVLAVYGRRVQLRSKVSDKEYTVDAYRLVEFEEL